MNGADQGPRSELDRPVPPGFPPPNLAEAAAAFKRGEATAEDVFRAFVAARLWSPRPPKPGVFVLDVLGDPVVPVFSSEEELIAFGGPTEWLSAGGADLLGLVPPGVTLGLDLASPHRLQLDPAAVRLERMLYVGAPEGPDGPAESP